MAAKINDGRSNTLWLALLLVAALTLVYSNHFDNAFQFDDMHTIVNNQYVTEISNLPRFFADATTASSLPTNQAYRPIITSLNAIDYWLAGGLDPHFFHWHIYLEFLLLLSLLWLLMGRVFTAASGMQHPYLALFATAFFAFHTATAETINYIIARSDGFSTLMVVTGMLVYVSSKGWKKQLGLAPLVVGCLAKPTALMLAPLVLVYELLLEPPALAVRAERYDIAAKLQDALKHTGSYFIFGLGLYGFTRAMFSDTWTPSHLSALDYLNTQPFVIWVYLKTFVLPVSLTADTDLDLIKDPLSLKVLWGLLVIASLLLIAWLTAKRRNTLPISFGILWFFIALIPSSSIIPLAEVLNHHRTFFPYIGLVMATTWAGYLCYLKLAAAKPLLPIKAGAVALAVALLAAHAYGTFRRNEVWDSELTLWRDVTIKSPMNGRGLMNYGLAEMRRGDMRTALSYFEKALQTRYGNHPYLYVNLAIATDLISAETHDSRLKGRARRYFQTAVRLGPEYPQVRYFYARWLNQNGHPADALIQLEKALALAPAHKAASQLMKDIAEARQSAIEAAAANTKRMNTPEAYLDLSLVYYQWGQYESSIEASRTALDLRPDYAEAYNNICAARNRLNEFERAVTACEQSLKIRPDYSLAAGNLRWAKSQLVNAP